MARARLDYEARLRAARVCRPPAKYPTLADLAATVYHQQWAIGRDGEVLTVDVLALDAAHAVVLGELTLLAGELLIPHDCRSNVPCPHASFEMKARLLREEPQAVTDHRQTTWGARQHAGDAP
jgi:hypothetical protein